MPREGEVGCGDDGGGGGGWMMALRRDQENLGHSVSTSI